MSASSISWVVKGLYGLGQSAESVKNFAFGTLLLLYYNQVLGVSGSLSGIAVAIALACDAITDPAVGSWSDGFRHRLGRRHLFMFASIVPLAITFYLLFWPPDGLSEFQLFLWLTFFAVACRTALTFFHVPLMALGAEMTPDYQERTQIASIRMAFGMLASFSIVYLAWQWIFVATPENATPQLTQEPYFIFALSAAGLMAVMMLISTLGTLSIVPHLTQAADDHPRFSLKRVYTDIYEALKNHSFFALFWGSLLFAVFMGIHVALQMHTKTFFWELSTTAIEYIQYASILGGLLGLGVIGLFHRVFDKRMTLIIGVVTYSVCQTLPIALQLMGLMPADKVLVQWILVVAGVVGYAGIIHAGVSGISMMGDIADEHELKHGRRQEGVYFGSHNFALKCTTAVGNLVGGLTLDLVSFPVNATPGEVPEQVLFNFGLVCVVLIVMAVIGIWVFLPYNLSRQRHEEIRSALEARAIANGNRG